MKNLFFAISLLLSLSAKCDTLDFWQVYIDNELVAEFNANSDDFTINMKLSKLKKSDTLTVRYFTDNPCADCTYGLTMLAEIKRSAPKAKSTVNSGALSISIIELLDIRRTEKISRFPFYYYRKAPSDKIRKDQLIFVLKVK